jgi:hypothetical protein
MGGEGIEDKNGGESETNERASERALLSVVTGKLVAEFIQTGIKILTP